MSGVHAIFNSAPPGRGMSEEGWQVHLGRLLV